MGFCNWIHEINLYKQAWIANNWSQFLLFQVHVCLVMLLSEFCLLVFVGLIIWCVLLCLSCFLFFFGIFENLDFKTKVKFLNSIMSFISFWATKPNLFKMHFECHVWILFLWDHVSCYEILSIKQMLKDYSHK